VTSYLSDVKYRAWGAPKETTYGNGLKMLATFDQNLMTASYTLTNPASSVNIMRKEYEYYPDNNLRYSEDLNTPNHDRLYEYDFGLRLVSARSGPEARGQTPTSPNDVPFREDFTHNAFGHMTSQTGDWRPGTDCSRDDFSDSNTLVNNRNTHSGASYDADGRQLHLMGIHKRFDARGSMIKLWNGLSEYDLMFAHDGNGQEVKRTEKVWDTEEMDWSEPETVYYIRSSALGGKILTEVASTGAKAKTYIYAGNEVLAEQNVNIEDNSSQSVAWEHWDASGVARVRTKPDGSTYIGGEEIDPLGHKFNGACFPPRPDRGYGNLQFGSSSLVDWSLFGSSNYGEGCFYEGVPELCQNVARAIGTGQGSVGEIRIFGPLPVFSDQSGRWAEGAIEQMLYDLRYEGEGESTLIGTHFGQANSDDDPSTVTVKAGSPIYQIVTRNGGQTPSKDEPCGDFFDCLKKILDLYNKQVKCDKRLAGIFGGPNAVVATLREPTTLLENGRRHPMAGMNRHMPYGNQVNTRESPFHGKAHLYGNPAGMGSAEEYAYVPDGFFDSDKPVGPNPKSEYEVQSNYIFKYRGGSLSRFGYSGNLRINLVHSGTTDKAGNLLPFNRSNRNAAGSIQVGVIGNYGVGFSVGGTSPDGSLTHVHMLFNELNADGTPGKSIDPRKVFCSDLGF